MSLSKKLAPLTLGLATILLLAGCDKQNSATQPSKQSSQETDAKTESNATSVTAKTKPDVGSESGTTSSSTNIDADSAVVGNKLDSAADDRVQTTGAEANNDSDSSASHHPSIAPFASKNVNAKPSLVTNPVKPNTPEAALQKALDTLYYGDAKKAAKYYQVDMKNFSEELAKTQNAFQQTVEAVTITNTTYNKDKTHAKIVGELKRKGQNKPAPLTYELQKIDGEWKILG